MRNGIRVILLGCALGAAFAIGHASAQDEEPDPAKGMEAWAALGKTGAEHAELVKMAGDWDCHVKSWMTPGAEPHESTSRTNHVALFGGRYLRQEYSAPMGDQTFEGLGYTAFNNATGKYEALWMDSASTGILFMTGTKNQEDGSVEYKGHWFGPGGAKIETRSVHTTVDDDKYVLTSYMDMGRGETKSAELTYTRVKADEPE